MAVSGNFGRAKKTQWQPEPNSIEKSPSKPSEKIVNTIKQDAFSIFDKHVLVFIV